MTTRKARTRKMFSMETITNPYDSLTEDERLQLLQYYIAEAEAGRIAFRKRGRPRKGSTAVSLHELIGITRQKLCYCLKMAKVAENDFKIGPRRGTYTMLVKAGQRRAVDAADTFEGTGLDQVARLLLLPAEKYLEGLSKADQKLVIRALRCQMQALAEMWRTAERDDADGHGKTAKELASGIVASLAFGFQVAERIFSDLGGESAADVGE